MPARRIRCSTSWSTGWSAAPSGRLSVPVPWDEVRACFGQNPPNALADRLVGFAGPV